VKIEKIKSLFTVPSGDPDLTLAQYQANIRQLPMMYMLLLVNTWVLVLSFWNQAPLSLIIYVPLGLTALTASRTIHWWRVAKIKADPDTALKNLRRTNMLAGLIAAGFSAWCLALYPYGDPYAQGHVAFFMGITVIGCIFSLMHIRSAALIVTIIVNAAFIGFFGLSGNGTLMAKALNIMLVSMFMLMILWNYYERFVSLTISARKLMDQQDALIQKQAETLALSNQNYHLANRDSLTNLPNRRCFFAELDRSVVSADAGKAPLAIGLIDLNGFKGLNDTHGHAVGDKLLAAVARRLEDTCEGEILLSRLGGDEFVVLIDSEYSDEQLKQIGRNFRAALNESFRLNDVTLSVTACVGFARWHAGISRDQLYENADFALYQAKRNREIPVALFTDEHERTIQKAKRLDQALQSPTLEDELSMVFQPMVDVNTGEVLAFEALARWTSPALGFVSPNEFIPAAERNGQIDRLTLILLRKALTAAASWPAPVRLSFNLSANNITSAGFVSGLIEEIDRLGADPTRIDFEITETAIIRDQEQVQSAIAKFKALGIRISLDDFGTGYSSLTHLHKFPLDKIKIDRSFVTNIDHTNSTGYGIVKSMLNLSREMQIGCVIEGIETAEELAVVRELGGELVQGYFYSKPLAEEDALRFVLSGADTGGDTQSVA
jgi:diguanylate cyclase (GGDEF)-like protein